MPYDLGVLAGITDVHFGGDDLLAISFSYESTGGYLPFPFKNFGLGQQIPFGMFVPESYDVLTLKDAPFDRNKFLTPIDNPISDVMLSDYYMFTVASPVDRSAPVLNSRVVPDTS